MNAKKSLRDKIADAYRKDYFFRIHNEVMKRQLKRPPNQTMAEEDVEPFIEYQLEERTLLQHVLYDLSKISSPQDVVARKVVAINLMMALASRQDFQIRKRRSALVPHMLIKRDPPDSEPYLQPNPFPLVCEKTQCIVCVGNERPPHNQRARTFPCVSYMMDHVENLHLRQQPTDQKIICHHPVCKAEALVLNNVMHFKKHVARVHGITLRA